MACRSQQQQHQQRERKHKTRGILKAAKHVRLASRQKQALRVNRDAHPKLSLRVLCKWVHTTFKLSCPPAHPTFINFVQAHRRSGSGGPGFEDTSASGVRSPGERARKMDRTMRANKGADCNPCRDPSESDEDTRQHCRRPDIISKHRAHAAQIFKRLVTEVLAPAWTQIAARSRRGRVR